MATLKLILAFILSIFQVASPLIPWLVTFGGDAYFTEWSYEDEFTSEDYIEIKKTPGEDFVILNLADLQVRDDVLYEADGECTVDFVKKLVAEKQPDLITLSGDNAWGTTAYVKFVNLIDSFGIPWAPVMGNHDGQRCPGEFWASYLFYKADNCLFEFGPEDMGYGNYIINITENGKIIHTLFMMDTHDSAEFVLEDGVSTQGGYDHLWPNQLAWYRWGVEGVAEIAGHTVESTVIMHIPAVEYRIAWEQAWDEENGCFTPEYAQTSFGKNDEGVCCSPMNNGFFDLCKQLGSTKNMIAGHDHLNDSSILYDGIRLSYSVKTGFGSYLTLDKIGCTTLTLNSSGNMNIQHHYYDYKALGYDVAE